MSVARHIIAATIMVARGMKWLVDIADEVHKVFEGFKALTSHDLPVR